MDVQKVGAPHNETIRDRGMETQSPKVELNGGKEHSVAGSSKPAETDPTHENPNTRTVQTRTANDSRKMEKKKGNVGKKLQKFFNGIKDVLDF